MSIGSLNSIPASLAGTQLAQQSGDVERAKQDVASQQRATQAADQADDAAGIGKTDGEGHDTNERDADGRRPWEIAAAKQRAAGSANEDPAAAVQSKDPTGQSGNTLDLTG